MVQNVVQNVVRTTSNTRHFLYIHMEIADEIEENMLFHRSLPSTGCFLEAGKGNLKAGTAELQNGGMVENYKKC